MRSHFMFDWVFRGGVFIAVIEIERLVTTGRVGVAGRVGPERIDSAGGVVVARVVGEKGSETAGSVIEAGRVLVKRAHSAGGVGITGRVEVKRSHTAGSVFVTRGIMEECSCTGGGVGTACGIDWERIVPKSDVVRTGGVRLQSTSTQRFIEDLCIPGLRSECQQRRHAQKQERENVFHDFIDYWRLVLVPWLEVTFAVELLT